MYEIEMANGDLIELSDNELKKWLNELCEYRRLEREGLLLRLPCKMEETVYYVYAYGRTLDGKILYRAKEFPLSIICFEDLNERVFATREEAEAKVKELEGE